jgi:hypothetical protein
LFAMRKFADNDLDEWRSRATALAEANTHLRREASVSPANPVGAEHLSTAKEQKPKQSRNGNKLVRRNQKYTTIDQALQEIAKSCPRTHEEVFNMLEGRKINLPPAQPFEGARGWVIGFQRNKPAARAWLSKRWAELNLAPFPRGPKNRK